MRPRGARPGVLPEGEPVGPDALAAEGFGGFGGGFGGPGEDLGEQVKRHSDA
jgi:hypothetical protein